MGDDHPEIKQLKDLDYFHPDLDRHKAEAILLQNGQDGTFLVRNSSNKDEYAVSVRAADAVKHFNLSWRDSAFHFGHGTYETSDDLAYHFRNQPMLGGESGQTTLMVDPYPRIVSEPNIYGSVRVHAEYSTGDNVPRTDFSFQPMTLLAYILLHQSLLSKINSKDGYLTKIGAIFKTWKVRWFVLQKNELKYFKDSSRKEPIRILDLDECKECTMEGVFRGKEHVFRLVFDWRTFYLFAANEKESLEWVKLINWRLDHRSKQ